MAPAVVTVSSSCRRSVVRARASRSSSLGAARTEMPCSPKRRNARSASEMSSSRSRVPPRTTTSVSLAGGAVLLAHDRGVGAEGNADVSVAEAFLHHLVAADATRPTDCAVCRSPRGVILGTPAWSTRASTVRLKLFGSIQPPSGVVKTSPAPCQALRANAPSASWRSRCAERPAAVPGPDRPEQRHDVEPDRPVVLVEGALLDTPLLRREPGLLGELREALVVGADPAGGDRLAVRQRVALRRERAELLYSPAPGGRVVAALPNDPLAALAVDLRWMVSAALSSRTALTSRFRVGLRGFEPATP